MKILAVPNVNSKYTDRQGKASFDYVDLCHTDDGKTPKGFWGSVLVDFLWPLGDDVYRALYSGKPVLLSIEVAESKEATE